MIDLSKLTDVEIVALKQAIDAEIFSRDVAKALGQAWQEYHAVLPGEDALAPPRSIP